MEFRSSPRAVARAVAVLATCAGTFSAHALAAQAAVPPQSARDAGGAFELTVPNIMRGPELVGVEPSGLTWTEDGRTLFFTWKPGGRPWYEPRSLWRYDVEAARLTELSDRAADSLGVHLRTGDRSEDGRWEVVSSEGDLYLVDRRTLETRRLTRTEAAEAAPLFGPEDATILFVRDDNIFELELDGGAVRQLTNLRRGSPPREDSTAEGQRGFLERQQQELFETLRIRSRLEERRDSLRELERAEDLTPLYLPEDQRILSLAVDPAGRFVAVEVGKPSAGDETVIVPDWVTESGYTETVETRSKVGDAQGETRLALIDIGGESLRWLELSPGKAEPDSAPAPGDERYAAVNFLGWNEQGTHGLIAAVSYDYKDQWLHRLDAATGELTLLAHDHDEAWIGGPCGPWTDSGCAGWLPGGADVWFISERSGSSHLYRMPAAGGQARALTAGDWEVYAAEVSPDERRFYLTTSEVSPFEVHFYAMPLAGGERTRITREPGRHDVEVSPDGRMLAEVYSYANVPPDVYVRENRAGAEPRRVTTSPTAEWLSYDWIVPEIVRFPARDGASVPARIYRPQDVGAQPNGAAVIFVHGAGYLHNVHDWWSSYYREYMFHHLLAEKGYTVLDIDYRGSAGYGRDWRTAIYRHMGGKDLTDQIDGAAWLVREGYATDPERIGIYGGSYGGFITLMALFTAPESFGAGAALRSVTDWAHYNHWYTSRILNLPQTDEEAYRRSSPIYFAEGLEDPLLIAHGMMDTNVHFSDVVRLAQRLIELGKEDWEMAVYPVENHSFEEPASWTDEYRRILELFERTIRPATRAAEGGA